MCKGTRVVKLCDRWFCATGDFVTPCIPPGVGLGDRGVQAGPDGVVNDDGVSTHYCLVAIGRLQVTSTPNSSDLAGSNSNNGKKNQFFCSIFC